MQTKIKQHPWAALTALGIALVILAAVGAYVGTADAVRGSGDGVSGVSTATGKEPVVRDSPIELIAISSDDMAEARPKLLDGDTAAFEELRNAGSSAEAYAHSSHYLAFVVSHLMDEDVLPDRDWDLGQALYEIRDKRLTTVISRSGVDLASLDPERFDMLELRREFHGGGELGGESEETALLDAIRVLRSNLEALDEGGALVLLFKPGA